MVLQSGLNATDFTASLWLGRVVRGRGWVGLLTSQTITVWSMLVVAMVLRSGLNATEDTMSVWSVRVVRAVAPVTRAGESFGVVDWVGGAVTVDVFVGAVPRSNGSWDAVKAMATAMPTAAAPTVIDFRRC